MSNKEENSFSNVVSINPYEDTYVSAISSFLTLSSSHEYTKDQYTISFLNSKAFINTHLSISKNIPDEDLYDTINTKVYDELGLDQAIEYHIQYIETFTKLDEDNKNFQVFIVDPIVYDLFKNSIEKIKYIDNIIPSPLLFKSLYSKDIISNNGVHCFIYFQDNDAFITIYNDKEFVYTKSINYSFRQMHERFCEIYGEQIQYEDFIDFLANANLKTTNSSYKEYFIQLYKEIFANINDILTYVKRALDMEQIEHIYIDTQLQSFTQLDEMAEVELAIKASTFNFDYGFENVENTDDKYIDELHSLMHLYTTLSIDEKYDCNFTIYNRPPKFIKRESGRLILLAVATLIIAFIYPISKWALTYAQNIQYSILQDEFSKVHNNRTTREATIKIKQADKAEVTALLQHENNDYIEKKNTLLKIHEVKVNYLMKADLLYKLTKDLNRYRVKLETLTYNENKTVKSLTLGLVSSRDKKITDLIKYLTSKYANKFHFSLNKIDYEENSKLYFSELEVTLL